MLFDVLMGRKSIGEYIKSLKLRFIFKYRKIKKPESNKKPPLKNPLKISNLQVVDKPSKEFSILTGEIENKSVRSIKNIISTIQVGDYPFFILCERIASFERFSFSLELSNSTLHVPPLEKDEIIISKEELLNKPIIEIETTFD